MSKKSSVQSKPKVVPKKSATAKPIAKPTISKSKKYIDTESESEADERKPSASSKQKPKPMINAHNNKSKLAAKAPTKKSKARIGKSPHYTGLYIPTSQTLRLPMLCKYMNIDKNIFRYQ